MLFFVQDFPFTSPADHAYLVARMLLPFCRRMIAEPTPSHLVTAPAPGSGKALPTDLVSILATARDFGLPVTSAETDLQHRHPNTKHENLAFYRGHLCRFAAAVYRPSTRGYWVFY